MCFAVHRIKRVNKAFMYVFYKQLAHLAADDEAPPPLSLYSFIALSYCFLASSAFFSHSYSEKEGVWVQ